MNPAAPGPVPPPPDPAPPAIRVIVLNFNSGSLVQETVDSLLKSQVSVPWHLRVVDNASTDHSAQDLATRFPDLDLVHNPENRGYAGGNNQAIRDTTEPFVLLVNHDIRVAPDTLERLYQALVADPTRAAVMPRLLFAERPATINLIGIALEPDGSPRGIGRGEPDGPAFDTSREIFGAHGACVLYRRAAIEEVGLFDEHYFAYNEEFDLAWRLRLRGHIAWYEASARAWHHEGIVMRKQPDRLLVLMERNRIWTLIKNASGAFIRRNRGALLRREWGALRHAIGMRTWAPLKARWQALLGAPGMVASRRRIQNERRGRDEELGITPG